jgi:diguanylate cyclase (GGDEF)-like protein
MEIDLNYSPDFAHILIVDDNPVNLGVLSDVLQKQGWRTLIATDGEAAIEQAEYAKPDLILLDVMMPEMDGFETCHRLKANPKTQLIPIIFMTALSNTTDKVKGLEMNAVDYITKPFQQEEVVARLKLHLKLSYLTQALQREIQQRMAAEAVLQSANNALQQLAYVDGLTQIPNRRQFDERFMTEWQRLKQEELPLSLILCDIDYFKQYNDTYGHLIGDDCLRSVATAITTAIHHSSALPARYGGEEFAVLLPHTKLEEAIAIAQNIQTAIKNLQLPHHKSQVSQWVTLSCGVATTIPSEVGTSEQLLTQVDRALYQAKLEGRNCIRSSVPSKHDD